MPARARRLLVGALTVHAAVTVVYAVGSPQPAFDFDRYHEIATAPGRPYRDYPVEFPPVTVGVFRALAHLPGGRAGFGLGIVALNLISDAIIVAALVWGWGEAAAAAFAMLVVPVIYLFFNRIDPWSAAAATLALAAWRRGAPRATGVALAVGASLKLWPLVLAGALFVPPRLSADPRRFRRLAIGAFAVAAAALAAVALLAAGTGGFEQVVTFRGARGWHIESFVGSLIHLAGATPRFESGAWRIGMIDQRVSMVMFALAAPACVWSSWRGARTNRVGLGALAAVAVLLLLSALFSAQYVVWLAPAAAAAWVEGARRATLLTALAVALTAAFWAGFEGVTASRAPMLVLVVARNVVVLALAAHALIELRRTPS